MHAHSLLVDPDLSFPVDSIKVHEDPAAAADQAPGAGQAEGAPVERTQNARVEGRRHTYSANKESRLA